MSRQERRQGLIDLFFQLHGPSLFKGFQLLSPRRPEPVRPALPRPD
jgi:hypothetical protein